MQNSTDLTPSGANGRTEGASLHTVLEKQRRFFASGKTRDPRFRLEQLRKMRDLLVKHEAEILRALHLDLGKPELEAYSTEVAYIKSDLSHMIQNVTKWSKPRKVSTPLVAQPASSEIRYEPYGVCLIMAPWNYPFQLLMSPLFGAMAAGNCAVLKASELTPHTQALLGKMISENFPSEYIHFVHGGLEESKALLKERFDFIFFTGGTEVGKIVMSAAAQYLTPVCLELGGKSPCIVEPDVNLKVAARRIVWGKFLNAGQSCIAPDYVYVHESIKAAFVEQLRLTLREFYGDDPRASDSYARVINEKHLQRLQGLLKGVNLVAGGQVDMATRYMAPTIVDGVTWDAPVMGEEVFGPILPILTYKNLDEVLQQVAARPKPLALYLFSKNGRVQDRVLNELSYGGACVNDTMVHLTNGELPFGGVGDSGMGAYHGHASFEVFSHKKSIMRKPFALDATMRYAPYTAGKLKLIRFFLS